MRRRRGRDARKEHAMASEGAGERDRDDADAPSEAHASPARRSWSQVLAPYAQPRAARSALDLATSLVPYLALSALAYATLDISTALALVVAVPTAGFLLRTFIVFHDCAHGSFLPTKRANAWLGRVVGLLVYQPFHSWRHAHAVHHAAAGDLDRRGTGDVLTLTVREYFAR